MQEFTYQIQNGRQYHDDPAGRDKWLRDKPDDYRGIEKHFKPSQRKTDPQLGFYWGLLVPEISKAIQALVWTVTVGHGKATFERKWDRGGDDKKYTDTHDWLKEYAAKIGDKGEYVTLSEQDKEMCRKFIDNVMWICDHWFKMDIEKLKEKRPEREAEDD